MEQQQPDLTESFLALAHAAFDLERRCWNWEDFHAWGAAHPAEFKVVTTEDEYRLKIGEEAMVSHWMRHLTHLAVDFRHVSLDDVTMTVQSIGSRGGVSVNKIPGVLSYG